MAKLLCIDDQVEIRHILAQELRAANHTVFEASNGLEGLEVIRRCRPDLVLCDVDMPEMDGRALLKEVRKEKYAFDNMPFVFITGFSDRQDIIDGKYLGADDYLTKPVDFDLVLATVQSQLAQISRLEKSNHEELFRREKEVKSAQATIRKIIHHDPVTELPNRLQLNSYLKSALIKGTAEAWPVVLCFVDIENFSAVKTNFGLANSDGVLRNIANNLTEAVASNGASIDGWKPMVFSLGGESFAIALADTGPEEDISSCVDKIMAVIAEPVVVDGRSVFVSASLGLASGPADGRSNEELQIAASVALQYAKNEDQKSWKFYDPVMNTEFKDRAELEHALREALRNDEFELHYQPQIAPLSLQVVGAEALVRWRHPKRGLIFPGDFIATAENLGLIVPLTEWVLKEACRKTKEWQGAGLNRNFQMAVNLSPIHLERADFIETLTEIVSVSGCLPTDFELEITESAILVEGGPQIDALRRIRELGFNLAIDDFGTGYSSLAYLKRFPFNILKIDRAFITGIELDPRDQAMVEAIINLGHCHDLTIVAEGVEEKKQQLLLEQLGCDRMQGYLFSRPLDASNFINFVNQFQNGKRHV